MFLDRLYLVVYEGNFGQGEVVESKGELVLKLEGARVGNGVDRR